MPRSSNPRHCRRRTLPGRLKLEIILRQNGRCTDCGTRLIFGQFVFDHRPPLALRDACADANDPNLVAAICTACNKPKTRDDLRQIARAKRRGFMGDQHPTPKPAKPVRGEPPGFVDVAPLPSNRTPTTERAAVRAAREQWARQQGGLRPWPRF